MSSAGYRDPSSNYYLSRRAPYNGVVIVWAEAKHAPTTLNYSDSPNLLKIKPYDLKILRETSELLTKSSHHILPVKRCHQRLNTESIRKSASNSHFMEPHSGTNSIHDRQPDFNPPPRTPRIGECQSRLLYVQRHLPQNETDS